MKPSRFEATGLKHDGSIHEGREWKSTNKTQCPEDDLCKTCSKVLIPIWLKFRRLLTFSYIIHILKGICYLSKQWVPSAYIAHFSCSILSHGLATLRERLKTWVRRKTNKEKVESCIRKRLKTRTITHSALLDGAVHDSTAERIKVTMSRNNNKIFMENRETLTSITESLWDQDPSQYL